ncbi:DUF3048 domain-containing protein, partial [Candidatus Parcubacteria bacterium]|nr:DUF3048 domain-containing protein [Candidatus Parcubacteria bacterium]
NKKDSKKYLDRLNRVIKDQDFQVIVLVISVIAATWLIKDLISPPSGSFFDCPPTAPNQCEVVLDDLGPDESRAPRHLDGVLVDKQASSTRALAVVLENYFESRPASGLSQASIVYETLAEGGITRFLALYDASSSVEEIGPVRSCRTYYLNLAEEYQALFAHVGGSPACLDNIKRRAYDVYDLNQYFKAHYFWRNGRQAPHNVYTSSELLNEYLNEMAIDKEYEFESWLYKDGQDMVRLGFKTQPNVAKDEQGKNIVIDYSYANYKVEWQYDEVAKDYLRYLGGKVHQDKDGFKIRAKNIIVQYVKTSLIDKIGRLKMELEGRGEALVFQDGKVIKGYWKKSERGERTRFYCDEDDEEIALNPGVTWVEIVPSDREVEWE